MQYATVMENEGVNANTDDYERDWKSINNFMMCAWVCHYCGFFKINFSQRKLSFIVDFDVGNGTLKFEEHQERIL